MVQSRWCNLEVVHKTGSTLMRTRLLMVDSILNYECHKACGALHVLWASWRNGVQVNVNVRTSVAPHVPTWFAVLCVFTAYVQPTVKILGVLVSCSCSHIGYLIFVRWSPIGYFVSHHGLTSWSHTMVSQWLLCLTSWSRIMVSHWLLNLCTLLICRMPSLMCVAPLPLLWASALFLFCVKLTS